MHSVPVIVFVVAAIVIVVHLSDFGKLIHCQTDAADQLFRMEKFIPTRWQVCHHLRP